MTLLRCTAAGLLVALGTFCHAADHLDAPNLAGNGQVDINDLYAFQSPANPNNSVLIMTVNPAVGVFSPNTFGSGIEYTFNIDNTGDATADVSYTATFGAPNSSGVQSVAITKDGAHYAAGSTGSQLTTVGGGQATAGTFDDPFFFDLNGFNNGLAFTGEDFFAGLNVSAIVLEVPSTELGGNIGVWATTSDTGGQLDRIGRPAINTVLIPSARKQEFNEAIPADDFTAFGSDVQATIEALNGGDMSHASTVTSVLLPDVLTFDTANPAGFLNGRGLTDDVIDAELTLLTNSATPIGDGVNANDVPFLNVFPYLAPANVPEPTSLALLALVSGSGLLRRRR